MSTKIQSFCGPSLFDNITPPKPIVEGIMWERQGIILGGSEKAGKSLQAKQLFTNIVTGQPYLGKFAVHRSGPVVYIQSEGDDSDFRMRLKRMTNGTFDASKFLHIYKKFLPLDTEGFLVTVHEIIRKHVQIWRQNPVAICLDSLYKCFAGSLISEDSRAITNIIDGLIDEYDAAVLAIHHESRPIFDPEAKNWMDRGDKGLFGSVFLRAWADHILFLKKGQNEIRQLSCDTQRSGSVVIKEKLVLIEPDPLFFELHDTRIKPTAQSVLAILRLINPSTATVDYLSTRLNKHPNTIRYSLEQLDKLELCKQVESYPLAFTLKI